MVQPMFGNSGQPACTTGQNIFVEIKAAGMGRTSPLLLCGSIANHAAWYFLLVKGKILATKAGFTLRRDIVPADNGYCRIAGYAIRTLIIDHRRQSVMQSQGNFGVTHLSSPPENAL
jgi:hypothetical protein